jgi:hypothetical protein
MRAFGVESWLQHLRTHKLSRESRDRNKEFDSKESNAG